MFRRLNPRKKKFVNSRVQGRLMLRFALYWVLYHVVLWHAIFVFQFMRYRMQSPTGGFAVPFREMYGNFVIDYYPVALCAALALPIVLLDMLYVTHRIVGPLVRFQNALRDLTAGKTVKAVQLRKGDLLTDFQDEFNRYLKSLDRPSSEAVAEDASADAIADGQPIVDELAELSRSLQRSQPVVDSRV